MNRAYCTYFDHNYLPRALLMLRSLRAFDAESTVYVLALSDLCAAALRKLALPKVELIALATIEGVYEELEDLKLERSPVEYIYTLTPFLPLYLFSTTSVETLTYIDADLYFFSAPQPFLDSISEASIAITPHRFSKAYLPTLDIDVGQFNVGWITFRRCAEALDCLAAYRANCVAWCYERAENGLFADQGYLNAWPGRYASLAVVEHKGVNVGLWNADNYLFEERDGAFFVDGEPLVCYHFHGIPLPPDGAFEVMVPPGHGARESLLMRRIQRPYMALLYRERAELHHRFPALAAAETNLRRRPTRPPPADPPRYVGKAWPELPQDPKRDDTITRYAIPSLFALQRGGIAVRDSPALRRAIAQVTARRSQVSVLDWRGGLGQSYYVARAMAPAVAFEWHVFESPSCCDHGAILNPEVRFHDAASPLPARRFGLVYARGTLGIDPAGRATLARLCRASESILLLDPVLIIRAGESCVIEHHPPDWPATARRNEWVINEREIIATAAAEGFALLQGFYNPNINQVPADQPVLCCLLFARS